MALIEIVKNPLRSAMARAVDVAELFALLPQFTVKSDPFEVDNLLDNPGRRMRA